MHSRIREHKTAIIYVKKSHKVGNSYYQCSAYMITTKRGSQEPGTKASRWKLTDSPQGTVTSMS